MIDAHPILDGVLTHWQASLGDDVAAYRGHVYRVFNVALELERFDDDTRELVATAIAFHDLGVWACDTMDYIHASAEMAADWVVANGRPEWAVEVRTIIEMHHKVTPYTGMYEATVETVRRADLFDFSYGWLPRDMPRDIKRREIRRFLNVFPDCCFHRRILKRIGGHMVRHPFSPLPMMRW